MSQGERLGKTQQHDWKASIKCLKEETSSGCWPASSRRTRPPERPVNSASARAYWLLKKMVTAAFVQTSRVIYYSLMVDVEVGNSFIYFLLLPIVIWKVNSPSSCPTFKDGFLPTRLWNRGSCYLPPQCITMQSKEIITSLWVMGTDQMWEAAISISILIFGDSEKCLLCCMLISKVSFFFGVFI